MGRGYGLRAPPELIREPSVRVGVFLVLLSCALGVGGCLSATAEAGTQGDAIVAAAQGTANQGYPYCFDGGNLSGPTVGITDPESDSSYSNCTSIGKVGFDCTGLTLYAVYQATGNASLSHDGHQARSGGGQVISSQAGLQPGDIVYFDRNAGNGLNYIDHAGIYVGGGEVLSAVSEKYGIRTESISWYEAGGLHFVGAVRFWSGAAGPPPPPPVPHRLLDANGDGSADTCFLTGLNGGSTGSERLEVHCALGGGFSSRIDQATPFGYINTQTTLPYFADINGDGSADMCFLTGLNGGSTGSERLEVHCAYGGDFSQRLDVATPFGYINTQTARPYIADVNGDGKADMCFLTGLNGGSTGSGKLEVHCALGPGFSSRIDQATPFGYINTQTAMPYFADINGDGSADLCFLTGLDGGSTGSEKLEVHCAYGDGFSQRLDVATPFGYINTQTTLPYFADVNGDGSADMCFLTGLNGGSTGSEKLEVHCAYGGGFSQRLDVATPFGYINTQIVRPYFADVNGDGSADVCFLTGLNGGATGSERLEVHCALGGGFSSRIDQATPFGYLNTRTNWILNGGPSVPLSPSSASALAGHRSASVSFAPTPYDGGNPITEYTVTSSPGGITATGSSSPVVVPGLSAGTSYTFTVTATNALGSSEASGQSNSVTPTNLANTPACLAASKGTTHSCRVHTSAKKCVVPRLRNRTLPEARLALRHAHCRLGQVRRQDVPRHDRPRRVRRQSAKHGTRHSHGYRVTVTLG